jgi:RNA polymerase sigma-70 factor (ECF subfamily)
MQFRTKTVWAAEDVVQEAFVRALKYKDAYIWGTPLDRWFSRILTNAFHDYMKAERDYSSIDDLSEEEERVECTSLPNSVKIELREAIEDLSPEHREIVELHLVYGFELRHIVQIVDVKYKTADQIIQRFKNSLKERYV